MQFSIRDHTAVLRLLIIYYYKYCNIFSINFHIYVSYLSLIHCPRLGSSAERCITIGIYYKNNLKLLGLYNRIFVKFWYPFQKTSNHIFSFHRYTGTPYFVFNVCIDMSVFNNRYLHLSS